MSVVQKLQLLNKFRLKRQNAWARGPIVSKQGGKNSARRRPGRTLCMKLSQPFSTAAVLFCAWLALLPPAASSQDFSSLDGDLSALENLIQDTLENSEAQMRQLEDLKKNLAESEELIRSYETIIAGREALLRDLRERLSEMSETYRKQSSLSAKYEKSSRFWKTFTLIAVPAAAILSGGLVLVLK
jgi:septal ring factor EnvC (AmiA/AmiB activator)